MDNIWEFYENMNELVYVADMDSYELIYMNRKLRELFGFFSREEWEGKKCHAVLRDCALPCAMCNNRKLREGSFAEWRYRSPILNKLFSVKATALEMDGRRYRMEMDIDVNTRSVERESKERFVNNEIMMNECLRVALAAAKPGESLDVLLEHLGQSLRSERAYIFEENANHRYDNTYEWCASGVIPQKENLQDTPDEVMRIWLERFKGGENIIIENLEDTKDTDPAMYEYLLPQDIHSLVASPLISGDRIIGFYGVDNPPRESLEDISTLLQIMGHFIVCLMNRRVLVERLENLSFYDQLTGFGNRHGMNEFMEQINPRESIGLVYCDVMGLKQINDSEGHQAGDDLLVRACDCLRGVFSEAALFRVGGDEFLVMCTGITEKTFQTRVDKLREAMQEKGTLMAIGSIWRPGGEEDIDMLVAEADQRMYQDKRNYYASR